MQTNASPSETDKEREILLKQFRAYLHLAITAKQTDQGKKLEAIPGPNTLTYCLELAELTDNTLARELAWPVVAVLDQISHVTNVCEGTLARQDEKSMAMHAKATRILDQLDFALALILRNHIWRIQHRGAVTKNVELLGLLTSLATGDGVEAARLIRRFQKLNPEDPREPDGSVSPESCPDEFAWDAYQRVEALDDLADEFPDHIRTAARSMHAWPMLMPRHTKQPPPVSTACQAVRFGRVLSDRCERRRTVPARHAAGAVSGSNV